MKKTVVIQILLLFFIFKVYSQAPPDLSISIAKGQFQAKQVVPPSPIAAELGKYGNVPVSLFTGTPSISIPLSELKGNILSLPVTLTYNAAGFKPEDVPTWVGSGWSLDAGGVITRSVMGNPDNQDNYFNSTSHTPPPDNDIVAMYGYMNNVQTRIYETQPDVYYYNFAGHSGKFVLNQDQSVVKKKKDMMKITSNNILITGGGSFTIVDEEGVIYTFSDVENSTTIPNDDNGGSSGTYNYPSAWFLSKIQSADNTEEIDFDYYTTTGAQPLYTNTKQNESYTYQHYTQQFTSCPGNTWGISSNFNQSIPPSNSIQRKFLNKITLKRSGATVAYIDLSSSQTRQDSPDFSEDRLLDQVSLYNALDSSPVLIKQYNLKYGYFINNSNLYNKKRLRLDSLQQISVNGTTASVPPYRFTYQASTDFPDRNTTNLDHWGFFNAAGNTSMVPSLTFHDPSSTNLVPVGGNANREPNLNATLSSILIKMQYPTGGYTTFDYELNQGLNNGVTQNVGGLRVKTIADYAVSGVKAATKSYTYINDDNSPSGVIINYPQYFLQSGLIEYGIGGLSTCEADTKTSVVYTMSANSVIGLGSIQGSHIGYTQVTESQIDNITSQSLGKTVYQYNIGSNFEFDDDIGAGDLLHESVYRSDGKLLKETINNYQNTVQAYINAYPVKPNYNQNNKRSYCDLSTGGYANYGAWETPPANCTSGIVAATKLFIAGYSFRSQYDHILTETVKTYDPDNNIYRTFTTAYSYDNAAHTYPTQITQTTTNNTQVVTQKKYAADYTYTGATSDVAAMGIKQLNAINMPGTEIESVQYRQNSDGSNKRYINGMITTFSPATIPMPDKLLHIETIQPLSTLISSTINSSGVFRYDSNYKLAGSFKYTADGNLAEQSKNGGPVTSYIWDYNTQYPIATVTNAASNVICHTSFETPPGGSNWITSGTGINTTVAFTGRQSATLGAGGRIYKLFTTAPQQLLLSYWASAPAMVKINNTTTIAVANQGITTNGWTYYEYLLPPGTLQVELTNPTTINIDELRLYPKDAQMQTQTYDPLVGITSQVSAANVAQYYTYDGLQRLTTVKDIYGNIKQYTGYNYGLGIAATAAPQTLFYNATQQQTFTKQGCPAGSVPTAVAYSVPFGKYAAATQAAADALATQEITANGQANANTNGQCLYFNDTPYSGHFFKNDCPPDQGIGGAVTYTVPVGTVSSTISVADANAKAQAQVTANGQAYANAHGTCSCGAEGQKVVNATCETGTKIYTSSSPSGTQYICVYHYVFSDGSVSQDYTIVSPGNCINN